MQKQAQKTSTCGSNKHHKAQWQCFHNDEESILSSLSMWHVGSWNDIVFKFSVLFHLSICVAKYHWSNHASPDLQDYMTDCLDIWNRGIISSYRPSFRTDFTVSSYSFFHENRKTSAWSAITVYMSSLCEMARLASF